MKNVLITGANKGIGFETAKQLAENGYFVYLGSRNQSNGEAAIQKLHAASITNVDLLLIDVSDSQSVKNAAAELATKVEALDILINNAAMAGDASQTSATYEVEKLQKVFNTNYFGIIRVTQAFFSLMENSESPHIINISSEVGSLGLNTSSARRPAWDLYNAYGSTKTAVNAFTVTLYHELKNTKFRVNSATPGHTATDLNNFQGLKTAQEGAAGIVRLAMNEDLSINGKFIKEKDEVLW